MGGCVICYLLFALLFVSLPDDSAEDTVLCSQAALLFDTALPVEAALPVEVALFSDAAESILRLLDNGCASSLLLSSPSPHKVLRDLELRHHSLEHRPLQFHVLQTIRP